MRRKRYENKSAVGRIRSSIYQIDDHAGSSIEESDKIRSTDRTKPAPTCVRSPQTVSDVYTPLHSPLSHYKHGAGAAPPNPIERCRCEKDLDNGGPDRTCHKNESRPHSREQPFSSLCAVIKFCRLTTTTTIAIIAAPPPPPVTRTHAGPRWERGQQQVCVPSETESEVSREAERGERADKWARNRAEFESGEIERTRGSPVFPRNVRAVSEASQASDPRGGDGRRLRTRLITPWKLPAVMQASRFLAAYGQHPITRTH